MSNEFYFHCTVALLGIELLAIAILFFIIRRMK